MKIYWSFGVEVWFSFPQKECIYYWFHVHMYIERKKEKKGEGERERERKSKREISLSVNSLMFPLGVLHKTDLVIS